MERRRPGWRWWATAIGAAIVAGTLAGTVVAVVTLLSGGGR